MAIDSTDNPELHLAEEFVNHTGCNLFLTGKAGTGKTTFLHNIRGNTAKRLVVTAPTGVAAINAGGVTIHSFFQLPFGPYAPGSDPLVRENHRLSREKRNIIKSLDLLVIDEISMVRADLLDLVDLVLRRYRRFDTPFGGVQLLMIGDLHQLPPVVKDVDWQILRPHYDSPYFFSSRALRQTQLVSIELKHIYRQTDQHFIDLLNKVRDNRLDPSSLKSLNSRFQEGFEPADDDGYITLTTHNQNADAINTAKLAELSGRSRRFTADLDGDFPEQIYPTNASLELKVGAQVMFVRNDSSAEKRFFNGKIGQVTKLGEDSVEVSCPRDLETIEVKRAVWENIEYAVEPETAEIMQKTIGTFGQFPLKLAWAITIHKSQGLTFERAVIDAQAAFAHGQVYVALSRCRSLEGMVLRSPLGQAAIKTDPSIHRFVEEMTRKAPGGAELIAGKIRYQQQLLVDCYQFQELGVRLGRLVSLLQRYESVLQVVGAGNSDELLRQVRQDICHVGTSFLRQLHTLFKVDKEPAADPVIGERLDKAADYFGDKLRELVYPLASNIQVETDNAEVRKQLNRAIKLLGEETACKIAAVAACRHPFSPGRYLRAISQAELSVPAKKSRSESIIYSEADVGHPELFVRLKEWRRQQATSKGLQLFQVMHQKTLVQLAVHLPDSLAALKEVHGIGPKMISNYGEELVALIGEYRQSQGITDISLPEPAKKSESTADAAADSGKSKDKGSQGDTREVSLALFRQGKGIATIASERMLTVATIENHLAHAVAEGKIDIQDLVTDEDRQLIERFALDQDLSMREIREACEQRVTYSEIRFVLAYLQAADKKAS